MRQKKWAHASFWAEQNAGSELFGHTRRHAPRLSQYTDDPSHQYNSMRARCKTAATGLATTAVKQREQHTQHKHGNTLRLRPQVRRQRHRSPRPRSRPYPQQQPQPSLPCTCLQSDRELVVQHRLQDTAYLPLEQRSLTAHGRDVRRKLTKHRGLDAGTRNGHEDVESLLL